jgi:MerR family transcriptional regulator, light-induced transcriptional regulator
MPMDGMHFGGRGSFAELCIPAPFGPVLEMPASSALARLVEAEILPRLMLAHRAAPRRSARPPSPDEIARVSALLLGPGPVDLDGQVDALLDGGLPLESLLLDLLAPAARHLGVLWEEDCCDFLTVTEGLGRLQAVTRRLCARLEGGGLSVDRRILLMPCPGETHVYGLSIVASFFREQGWDATVLGRAEADPEDVLGAGWYDAVGLSLSCDVLLPALKAAVPALRRASRNPNLAVIVGGPWFARTGATAEAVGADACAADARSAPGLAEALLDRPALAC